MVNYDTVYVCCWLRLGTIIWASFSITTSVLGASCLGCFLCVSTRTEEGYSLRGRVVKIDKMRITTTLLGVVVALVIDSLLLVGGIKIQKAFLLPWMISYAFVILSGLIATLIFAFQDMRTILNFIWIGLLAYVWHCTLMFYLYIKKYEEN